MNRIGNSRLINSVLRLDQKNGLSNSLQKIFKNYYNESQFQFFYSFTFNYSSQFVSIKFSHWQSFVHRSNFNPLSTFVAIISEHWQSSYSLSFEPIVYRIAANLDKIRIDLFPFSGNNEPSLEIHLHLHFPISFTGRIPLNT